MTNKKLPENPKPGLDQFEPGGDRGPLEDRRAYEQRLESLPPSDKELAQESARFADLCQYFERQRMDVPVEIIDELRRLSSLAVPQRVDAMKKLNQRLMEHLNAIDQDSGIRQ